MTMVPRKLQPGDEVRVIAPSRSLGLISEDTQAGAVANLAKLGLKVSFGDHVREMDEFLSSSIRSRLADLHAAFADPQVAGILTVIGGFNANQLLDHLDYELIRANPKALCGYSDITALAHAITARTGLITYSGPHFSTFGMQEGVDYIINAFRNCLMAEGPFTVPMSPTWSDDAWWLAEPAREFLTNPGPVVLQAGRARGPVIGGNLCTLNLLQGTRYLPDLRGAIVFVEEDAQISDAFAVNFDRDLQSLLHQPGADALGGLVFGRFQKESRMDPGMLARIVETKGLPANLPIVAGMDFGHTMPFFTFPIGGTAALHAEGGEVRLTIERH